MTEQQVSITFPALGSTAFIAVTEDRRLQLAVSELRDEIEELDRTCSRFRDDSELSALNAAAGAEVAVSELLLEAIQAALRAAFLTDGDVDPTIGRALVALGYDRDFDSITDAGRPRFATLPGWRSVAVDSPRLTVRVPRGVSLDLGATAKALGADRAARRVAAAAECGVLVGLGGDFAVAGEPPAGGWRIRVTDDHRSGDAPGQWVTLRSGGLATSSVTARQWSTGGGVAHHLIDPATARPVEPTWRTASVAAVSCLDANIASTASIVMRGRAVEWLGSRALPSRLVTRHGTVCHLCGWPADGEELPAEEPDFGRAGVQT